MLDRTATAWLRRLLTWLEPFEDGCSRQRQRGTLRRYVTGMLNDSRRKSMEAMWARLSDPGTYQAFQHFITHAPWDAEALWTRLRAVIPERRGVLILDSTSFPKQGTASVGVARQYCGALGKTANCQVAVTVALWTGVRAWFVGAALYLSEAWLTPRQRERARIPDSVVFRPKGQLALTLWRQVRTAGLDITAVVGDAECGNNATLRRTLHRARLLYALGVSSDLTMSWVRTPPPWSDPSDAVTRARRDPGSADCAFLHDPTALSGSPQYAGKSSVRRTRPALLDILFETQKANCVMIENVSLLFLRQVPPSRMAPVQSLLRLSPASASDLNPT